MKTKINKQTNKYELAKKNYLIINLSKKIVRKIIVDQSIFYWNLWGSFCIVVWSAESSIQTFLETTLCNASLLHSVWQRKRMVTVGMSLNMNLLHQVSFEATQQHIQQITSSSLVQPFVLHTSVKQSKPCQHGNGH